MSSKSHPLRTSLLACAVCLAVTTESTAAPPAVRFVGEDTLIVVRIDVSQPIVKDTLASLDRMSKADVRLGSLAGSKRIERMLETLRGSGVTTIDIAFAGTTGIIPNLTAMFHTTGGAASKLSRQTLIDTLEKADIQGIKAEQIAVLDGGLLISNLSPAERKASTNRLATAKYEQALAGQPGAPLKIAIVPSKMHRAVAREGIPLQLPEPTRKSIETLVQQVEWICITATPQSPARLTAQIGTSDPKSTSKAIAALMASTTQFANSPALELLRSTYSALQATQQDESITLTLTEGAGLNPLAKLLSGQLHAAHQSAHNMVTENSMKQLGLACHLFHDKFGSFPPVASFDDQGNKMLSWRVYVLPFIDQSELYEKFHLDEPWDSPHNRELIKEIPHTFADAAHQARPGYTRILAVEGEQMAFTGQREGLALVTFTDGASQTILMVEVPADQAVPWTKPVDYAVDPDDPRPTSPDQPFPALFADGSVRPIEAGTDAATLLRMMTRNEGTPAEQ